MFNQQSKLRSFTAPLRFIPNFLSKQDREYYHLMMKCSNASHHYMTEQRLLRLLNDYMEEKRSFDGLEIKFIRVYIDNIGILKTEYLCTKEEHNALLHNMTIHQSRAEIAQRPRERRLRNSSGTSEKSSDMDEFVKQAHKSFNQIENMEKDYRRKNYQNFDEFNSDNIEHDLPKFEDQVKVSKNRKDRYHEGLIPKDTVFDDDLQLQDLSSKRKPHFKSRAVPQMAFPYEDELRDFNANVEDFNMNFASLNESMKSFSSVDLNGLHNDVKDFKDMFGTIAESVSKVCDSNLPENMSQAFASINQVASDFNDPEKLSQKINQVKDQLIQNFSPQFSKTTCISLSLIACVLLAHWWYNKDKSSLVIGSIILVYLWWTGFLSFENLKNFIFNRMSPVMQPQMEMDSDTLMDGLSCLLGIATLGDAYHTKGLSSKLMKIANFDRSLRSVEMLFNGFKRIVDYLVNKVRTEVFKKEPILLFTSGNKMFDEFYQRFKKLQHKVEKKDFPPSPENFEKLCYLRDFADHVLINLPRGNNMGALQSIIRNAMSSMDQLKMTFMERGYDKEGMHAESVSIYLFGRPGAGKSIGLFMIAFSILSRYLSDEDYKEFVKNPWEFMWNVQVENKYADGFRYKTILAFWDDMFQFRDVEGNLDSDASKWIRYNNIFPCMLHSADIREKGNLFATLLFILATSNMKQPYSQLIHDQGALRRRCDFCYEVEPYPEYCIKENGISTGKLDYTKLPIRNGTTVMDMNVLMFREYDPETGQSKGGVYDIHTVISRMMQLRRTKDKRHENQVAVNMEAMVSGRAQVKLHEMINKTALPLREIGSERNLRPSEVKFFDTGVAQMADMNEDVQMDNLSDTSQGHTEYLDTINMEDPQTGTHIIRPSFANHNSNSTHILPELADNAEVASILADMVDNSSRNSVSYAEVWDDSDYFHVRRVMDVISQSATSQARVVAILNETYRRNFWLREVPTELIIGGYMRRDKADFVRAVFVDDDFIFDDFIANIHSKRLTCLDVWYATPNTKGNWFTSFGRHWCALSTWFVDAIAYCKAKLDDWGLSWTYEWINLSSKYVKWIGMALFFLTSMVNTAIVDRLITTVIDTVAWFFGRRYVEIGFINIDEYDDWVKFKKEELNTVAPVYWSLMWNVHKNAGVVSADWEKYKPDLPQTLNSLPGNELKPADAQMGNIDPQGMTTVDYVFRNSMFSIKLEGTDAILGHGVFVKERYFLMPHHYISKFSKEFGPDYGDRRLVFVSSQLSELGLPITFSSKLSDLMSSYSNKGLISSDLVLVYVKDCGQLKRNIIGFFLTEEILNKQKEFPILVAAPDNKKQRIGFAYGAYYNHPVTCKSKDLPTYVVDRTVQYPLPTAKGDCGAVAFLLDSSNVKEKIIGLHTLGMEDGSGGMASVVTQEMLNEAINSFDTKAREYIGKGSVNQLLSTFKAMGVPQMNEFFYGRFPIIKKVSPPLSQAVKHDIRKSKLYDLLGPSWKAPAKLKPFVLGDRIIDPFENYLNKMPPLEHINSKYVEIYKICAKHYIASVMPAKSEFKRMMSVEESALGVKGTILRPIPRNTSIGWPYVWSKIFPNDKASVFGSGQDYDINNQYFPVVKENVLNKLRLLFQGIRPEMVFVDFLKAELRKLSKVETGQTRGVSGAGLDEVILQGMLFGGFMIEYGKAYRKAGFLGLVNPYSTDWQDIVNDFAKVCSIYSQNFGAGDYAGFDTTQSPELHKAVLEAIIDWYGYPIDKDFINIAMRTFWQGIYNSWHIRFDVIYMWEQGMPSGQRMTTLLNTMIGQINFRFAWCILHGNTTCLNIFDKHVCVKQMGDDNAFAVSNEYRDRFNERFISEALAKIKFDYTSDSKEAARVELRFLNEISILKRYFIYHPIACRIVAPLEIYTIWDSLLWTKKGKEFHKITHEKVKKNLQELTLWGEEVYNTFSQRIIEAYLTAYPGAHVVSDYRVNLYACLDRVEDYIH